jgi:hypothetical protein
MGCGLYSSGSRQNLIVKSCEYENELSTHNQGCTFCLDKCVLLGVSYLFSHNGNNYLLLGEDVLECDYLEMEDRCKDNIILGNKCRIVVDCHWCGYDKNDAEHWNSSTEARVIQRSVGKHVLSMKATSFRDDEPRLVSHCRNVKASIYPCERIQTRRITRLSNLF